MSDEQLTEEEIADITNPDGTYDAQKLMVWIKRRNRRRAKELAAAWGTYAPLYFPWHDGTERLGE
jgi:hypothetical protein